MSSCVNPVRAAFLLLALLLFGLGAVHHYGLMALPPGNGLFGDAGDGLLNLWILEHARTSVLNGPTALANGNMFYPHQQGSYWWSDNHLAFVPLYSLLRFLLPDTLAAYGWSVVLLSAASFLTTLWLILEIRMAARVSGICPPRWTLVIAPLLAYALHFTHIRIHSLLHFQLFASLFLTSLAAAGIRSLRQPSLLSYAAVCLSFGLLLYSSAYFALIAVPVVAWLGCLSIALRPSAWRLMARRMWPSAVTTALVCLPVALAYLGTERVIYDMAEVNRRAIHPLQLLVPSEGPLSAWLPALSFPFSACQTYMGLGLMIGLAVAALSAMVHVCVRRPPLLRDPFLWCLICGILLTTVDAKEIKGWTTYLRALLPALVMLWILLRWRKRAPSALTAATVFLLGAAWILITAAMGEAVLFKYESFDPGTTHLLRLLLPGFTSIRDISRFLLPAQTLLGGLAVVALFRGLATPSRLWQGSALLVLILCLLIQVIEVFPARAKRTAITSSSIQLNQTERDLLAETSGPILVLPCTPFHHNARYLMPFLSTGDVVLVNGYSGRSTPEFTRLMDLERRHGIASVEQLNAAGEQGIREIWIERTAAMRVLPDRLLSQSDSASPPSHRDRYQQYPMRSRTVRGSRFILVYLEAPNSRGR